MQTSSFSLRSTLPSLKSHQKRVSKLKILKASIDYIYKLTDQIDSIVTTTENLSLSSNVSSNLNSPYSENIPATLSNESTTVSTVTQSVVIPTLSSTLNFPSYMNFPDIASYVYNSCLPQTLEPIYAQNNPTTN
jgi:hypothetical protein